VAGQEVGEDGVAAGLGRGWRAGAGGVRADGEGDPVGVEAGGGGDFGPECAQCLAGDKENSFKYASKRDWAEIAKDLKPVYTAAFEVDALDRFADFSGKWEKRYPTIIRLWENAWAEFVPFLRFDREIRTVICTTNAIESINARLRRAVNARGHFPTEQAAMKCLYLAIMSLDPTGKGRKRWTNRWKAALNAFDIT
jgi:putative transposase